jgi:DNA gyrase subunit A
MAKIYSTEITQELKVAYLDYAMSVIVARALPDVRDGLKPVQRRILFTMHEMNLGPQSKYRKSAAITGTTLARYHPHGDMPVYEALARMAQDFTLRYPVIDGQGNFGCFAEDVKVQLTDGRSLSFGELVNESKQGKRNYTYTFNHKQGRIEIAQIKDPRLTRKRAEIIEITLDNGEKIECTLDHPFLMRDGSYKKAVDLRPNDSLMPLYPKLSDGKQKLNLKGYLKVLQPAAIDQVQYYNHKIVATRILKKRKDVYDLTVEPWHNFALAAGIFVHNSTDDPPAASRYTEARLSSVAAEMLKDIEKGTVDWSPNYDNTRKEPQVLPAALPQLLLNGAKGIAVGMATNIPPHNLGELIEALILLIDKGEKQIATADLLTYIQGPDFPGGGIIYNQKDLVQAYSQGRGSFIIRAKTHIESGKGCERLVITELPYQVSKDDLIVKIAALVKEERLSGIRDIIDESDRKGTRILVELKSGVNAQSVLNQLFQKTPLQTAYHLNMIALVGGLEPRLLSLKDILVYFLKHRFEVVRRRTEWLLKRVQNREHILLGLVKALEQIDEIIKTIKKSKDKEAAFKALQVQFDFSEKQAEAILKMRLQRLAALEVLEIKKALEEAVCEIKKYQQILRSEAGIRNEAKKELLALKAKFSDKRRTQIVARSLKEFRARDVVVAQDTLVTLTYQGRIKRLSTKTYRQQFRGGKGVLGELVGKEDFVKQFLKISTHDVLLIFSEDGRAYSLAGYEIPKKKRSQKGEFLSEALSFEGKYVGWAVKHIFKSAPDFLVLASQRGKVKRLDFKKLGTLRRSGLKVLGVKKGDSLAQAALGDKSVKQLILLGRKGRGIRFKLSQIPALGRGAGGVQGIRLGKDDSLMALLPVDKKTSDGLLLTLTEFGFAKKTPLKNFRLQSRGGKGLLAAKITKATGDLAAAALITKGQKEILVISSQGKVIRVSLKGVPARSRRTQGVRLMRLDKDDKVAAFLLM